MLRSADSRNFIFSEWADSADLGGSFYRDSECALLTMSSIDSTALKEITSVKQCRSFDFKQRNDLDHKGRCAV
jgi:hypothetical protein